MLRHIVNESVSAAQASDDATASATSLLTTSTSGIIWPAVKSFLDLDATVTREVLSAVASDSDIRGARFADRFGVEITSEIFTMLASLYPPAEDPHRDRAGVVSPREQLSYFRNSLLREIVSSGDASAVAALDRIAKSFPDQAEIRWLVADAKKSTLSRAWQTSSHILDDGTQETKMASNATFILAATSSSLDIGAITQAIASEGGHTLTDVGDGILSVVFRSVSSARILELVEQEALEAMVLSAGGQSLYEVSIDDDRVYEFTPAHSFEEVEVEPVSSGDIDAAIASTDLVILTATPVERHAVHAAMTPLPGRNLIIEGEGEYETYRFGCLGRYQVAHVECAMGSANRAGAGETLGNAIREVSPKAVLVLGIAFGLKVGKQHYGDVLLAESILPYTSIRLGDETKRRGHELPCGIELSKIFRTRTSSWKMKRGPWGVKIHSGVVLSGEPLVDNREFVVALQKFYPEANGGEMEGIGSYVAAHSKKVEVLLVKSVCDWGYGKHKKAQPFAAHTSVSLAKHVLDQPNVLRRLDISEASSAGGERAGTENTDIAPVVSDESSKQENPRYVVYRTSGLVSAGSLPLAPGLQKCLTCPTRSILVSPYSAPDHLLSANDLRDSILKSSVSGNRAETFPLAGIPSMESRAQNGVYWKSKSPREFQFAFGLDGSFLSEDRVVESRKATGRAKRVGDIGIFTTLELVAGAVVFARSLSPSFKKVPRLWMRLQLRKIQNKALIFDPFDGEFETTTWPTSGTSASIKDLEIDASFQADITNDELVSMLNEIANMVAFPFHADAAVREGDLGGQIVSELTNC